MFMQQKKKLVYLLLGTLLVFTSHMAQAQDFPTKPVTLIAPWGAGGSFDLTGRALISVAAEHLGQPIIFQLKPGGGGAIGTDFVAKAAPDGYTLLFGGPGPNSTLPAVEGRSKGPDDLAAVCRINYNAVWIIVRSDAPFQTFKEMVEWAKTNPGKMIFGNAGPWGASDLSWKQIKHKTGITTRDVPHSGGGPMLTALLGGHIQVGGLLITQSLPHIRAGKLRALAVLDNKRDPQLPDVPTLQELGIDVVYLLWKGIIAPKDTPRAIIDKLAGAFNGMCKDKSFVRMIKRFGDDIHYLGPDEFAKFWREEYELHKEIGKVFKK